MPTARAQPIAVPTRPGTVQAISVPIAPPTKRQASNCAVSITMGYSAAITGPLRSRISRNSAPDPI